MKYRSRLRFFLTVSALPYFIACSPSAKQTEFEVKLIGSWRIETKEFEDTSITIANYSKDKTYSAETKLTKENGEVENFWEKGRWTITPNGKLRSEATETSEGKPKTHEAVYDLVVHSISDSTLELKSTNPKAKPFKMERVQIGSKP
jgi:hypothetical protein